MAAQANLPVRIVRLCVERGVIHPDQRDDISIFHERELLVLKMVRFLMRAANLIQRAELCRELIGGPPHRPAYIFPEKLPAGWIAVAQEMLQA